MQHVRRSPFGERLPLLDAEAVLLVDNRHGEVVEPDSCLDQCMRADDDVGLGRKVALSLRRGARQQRARDAERAARLVEREEVLFRQRLGRRHQRALATRLYRTEQRVQRDDGLARADVALQQALHRDGSREIGVDLGDRTLLVLGQLERQHVAVAGDELSRRGQLRRNLRLALATALREADLQQEQLVEREPAATTLGLVERARPVQRPERVGAIRQQPRTP